MWRFIKWPEKILYLQLLLFSNAICGQLFSVDYDMISLKRDNIENSTLLNLSNIVNVIEASDSFYFISNSQKDNLHYNRYYSLARYYWPNNSTTDGVPYVFRDGLVNPEIDDYPDKKMLVNLSNDIFMLGLGYYFSNDIRYVVRANYLLNIFFFEKDTCMIPDMVDSQVIKGFKESGGKSLDAVPFIKLLDGINLMKDCEYFEFKNTRINLKLWFKDFVFYLENDFKSKMDKKAENNLKTFYLAQLYAYKYFVFDSIDEESFVKDIQDLVNLQVDSTGRFFLEEQRSHGLDYVLFNFEAFGILNRIGKILGIDILTIKNTHGFNLTEVLCIYTNNDFKSEERKNLVKLRKFGLLGYPIIIDKKRVIDSILYSND